MSSDLPYRGNHTHRDLDLIALDAVQAAREAARHAVLIDGGVRAIKPLIRQQIWTLFISPNDGGIIGADVW